ncbi:putative signal peptide protein [Puccinia sorghi]|uniref:Putative signal peptide protein n=1 Tax=Puccinia sorghi TaxID=27349 RepID=A0A0L6VKH6_9BASI|nr:putative signal peptide protein [Puccinia sorghi]
MSGNCYVKFLLFCVLHNLAAICLFVCKADLAPGGPADGVEMGRSYHSLAEEPQSRFRHDPKSFESGSLWITGESSKRVSQMDLSNVIPGKWTFR